MHSGLRIQIHAKFFSTFYVIDEFTISTSEIQDGGVLGNISLEIILGENGPQAIAISAPVFKASLIDALQFARVFDALRHVMLGGYYLSWLDGLVDGLGVLLCTSANAKQPVNINSSHSP